MSRKVALPCAGLIHWGVHFLRFGIAACLLLSLWTTPALAAPSKESKLLAWVSARLPPGGAVVAAPSGVALTHTARRGDTVDTIAEAYLDLTAVYLPVDLAAEIAHGNHVGHGPLTPGARIAIPHVLTEPYEASRNARLPDADLATTRGLYVRGDTAARPAFEALLERMAERGIDTIVLDAKDYDGLLTYPSRVALANDAGAVKHPPIRDLARTLRLAHKKGIRVAVRISCFEDELMARARPLLSVRSKAGNAYRIGWLEPSNPDVHAYVIALAEEAMDAGADEIQLDYVRYPVLGIHNADFHLAERGLSKPIVIRDFVRKVHAATRARGVPLTLDVFGVVALGKRADIESLGQDPVLLARECEVLSPMAYPSHFAPGFLGKDEPGDHPELVGYATRAFLGQMPAAAKRHALVRPWLQAMHWKSPSYSPSYLAAEVHSARAAGAAGWMMWNPGQDYRYAWIAVPKPR